MAHSEIEIRTVGAQPFAYVATDNVAPPEIGKAFMTALPEVYAHVGKSGGQPVGGPTVRYTRHGQGTFDMETGTALAAPIEPGETVRVGELPGGEVAFTVHTGSYRTLGETYEAVRAWFEQSGRAPGGAPWEVYVDDPQATPEDQLRTELYQPIA